MKTETVTRLCGRFPGLRFTDETGQDWVIHQDVNPPYIDSESAVAVGGPQSGMVKHLSRIPEPNWLGTDEWFSRFDEDNTPLETPETPNSDLRNPNHE